MFNFVSRGRVQNALFSSGLRTKISNKNDFFVLLANMECCYQSVKILEEMIHSKCQRATPEFPVFFILRCLKMHN